MRNSGGFGKSSNNGGARLTQGSDKWDSAVAINFPMFILRLRVDKRYRLRLHGIGYVQICLGSDPLWYGSTLFTRDRP